MASAQMKRLLKIGKFSLYWAGKGFKHKGLWIWTGKSNVRVFRIK